MSTGELPTTPAATAVPHAAAISADVRTLSRLDPRHVAHGRVVGAVTTAIAAFALAIAVLVVLVAADGLSAGGRLLVAGGALALVAAAGATAWWWPAAVHAHTGYRWGDDGLEIRRGVWWRREIHLPRSRVQHTDVSQGPLERRFGLATLHVFTAGTENAEVRLGGLAHATAMAVRDHLLAGTGDDVV
jgi:hypothetical protein